MGEVVEEVEMIDVIGDRRGETGDWRADGSDGLRIHNVLCHRKKNRHEKKCVLMALAV